MSQFHEDEENALYYNLGMNLYLSICTKQTLTIEPLNVYEHFDNVLQGLM